MSKPVWALDATETAALIRSRALSAREAVTAHLERLDAVNPKLNAVVRVLREEALDEARAADEALARGEPVGPLHGVPITTKINSDQKGCPTDNGVTLFRELMAAQDAPQVANLRRAGAIVIGRTNSPAFAMRAVTDNALHGLTLNPWDRNITCGGSSGGAGSSLAAGIGALAQGNDIGGSIRWPAYCNGITGLRPTVGRVPAHNATATMPRAFAAQLMSVNGPMARSVRDLKLGLHVMAKGDPRDPVWAPVPLEMPQPGGTPTAAIAMDPGLPPAVTAMLEKAAAHLRDAGYRIVEATPPGLGRASELWPDIGLAEIGASLLPLVPAIGDEGMKEMMEGFWQLKGHSDIGRYMSALRERESIIIKWQLFLQDHHVVVLPSCAEVSLHARFDTEGIGAAEHMLSALRYQLAIPVLGLPSLALPLGTASGLPTGVQIVSGRFREDLCLAAAAAIEARQPPIAPIDVRW